MNMAHFHIFLNIITLMIGTWAVFYAWQMHKSYVYPFLAHLVAFLFSYCLLLFNNLMAWYWMTNLFQDPVEYSASLYGKLGFPLGFLFSALWIYFLIHTVINLQKKTRFKPEFHWFYAALVVVGLVFMTVSLATPENKADHWMHLGVTVIIYMFLGMLLTVLLVFWMRGKKILEEDHKRMLISLTSFYFVTLVGIQIIARFFSQENRIYVAAILNLVFTLFPFYWLRRYFLAFHRERMANTQTQGALDLKCERYGISQREREVAELILQGLKNQEIERRLIISPHTVKNHIYHLYKKAGVSSRVQFVKLMLGMD